MAHTPHHHQSEKARREQVERVRAYQNNSDKRNNEIPKEARVRRNSK